MIHNKLSTIHSPTNITGNKGTQYFSLIISQILTPCVQFLLVIYMTMTKVTKFSTILINIKMDLW